MKKLILPILWLMLFLVACTPIERGEITFVTVNSTLHDDQGLAQVVINSTFESQKMATVTIDGYSVGECLLMPSTDTNCGTIGLQTPGSHTIGATVTKTNGDTVSAQTSVNWSPYTALDKLAQSLAGGEGKDPAPGYIMMMAVFAFIAIVLTGIIGANATKGSAMGFGVGGLYGLIIGLLAFEFVVYMYASSTILILTLLITAVVVIVAISLIVKIYKIKNGHSSTFVIGKSIDTLPDGTRKEKFAGQLYAGPSKDGPNRNSEAFREDYERLLEERRLKQLPDTSENW